MKLCPRSARALCQPCDDQHATEWCISMFNPETCKDCSEGCKPNRKLLCELIPSKKTTVKTNEKSDSKNEQLRLF